MTESESAERARAERELDAAVNKALDDGDNITALVLLVKAAGGQMTFYGQPVDAAEDLRVLAHRTLLDRFRWCAFTQSTLFRVPLRQIAPELRSLISAARKMRGGDGGRDTSKWWRSIPRVQRTVASVAISGEIANAS